MYMDYTRVPTILWEGAEAVVTADPSPVFSIKFSPLWIVCSSNPRQINTLATLRLVEAVVVVSSQLTEVEFRVGKPDVMLENTLQFKENAVKVPEETL